MGIGQLAPVGSVAHGLFCYPTCWFFLPLTGLESQAGCTHILTIRIKSRVQVMKVCLPPIRPMHNTQTEYPRVIKNTAIISHISLYYMFYTMGWIPMLYFSTTHSLISYQDSECPWTLPNTVFWSICLLTANHQLSGAIWSQRGGHRLSESGP